MVVGHVARRAAVTLMTGVSGVIAVDAIKRLARVGAVDNAAVTATSWGLRGKRSAEAGAENLRLATADIVSEARERIGEQSPAPGAATDLHEHGH